VYSSRGSRGSDGSRAMTCHPKRNVVVGLGPGNTVHNSRPTPKANKGRREHPRPHSAALLGARVCGGACGRVVWLCTDSGPARARTQKRLASTARPVPHITSLGLLRRMRHLQPSRERTEVRQRPSEYNRVCPADQSLHACTLACRSGFWACLLKL